jgi:hypothetical protein
VKTGIQFYINRHDFWIPTYVGMTKNLKNGTYIQATQVLDRGVRRHLRCEPPLPENCPLTVLGSSRGVKSLWAGDSKGVSPLVFFIHKENESKNQVRVIKIGVTNLAELAQHADKPREQMGGTD